MYKNDFFNYFCFFGYAIVGSGRRSMFVPVCAGAVSLDPYLIDR